jgi:Spy/CpxP family protein refolding chaperone
MTATSVWRWATGALLVVLLAGTAWAQDDDTGMPYGPMGMTGPCPMMGGGMGMMGGRGMGMGMGPGMGPGMGMMGGMGPYGMLDLTTDQRNKINKIHDEARRKNWDTLGKMQDEQAKLRDLYAADKRDPKAISAVVASVQALERQILEVMLDAHNRMDAVLTDAQREQLKQWRGMGPGMRGMMGGPGPGPGMRGMMYR